MKDCIQCCDCKHYCGNYLGFYCEAVRYKGVAPYQCTTFATGLDKAWEKCNGKFFEKKKTLLEKLFG